MSMAKSGGGPPECTEQARAFLVAFLLEGLALGPSRVWSLFKSKEYRTESESAEEPQQGVEAGRR